MSSHDEESRAGGTRTHGNDNDRSLTPAHALCQKGASGTGMGVRSSRPEHSKMPTPAEVKKALIEAGFEVYRTRGDTVHVAERVRENLIMDSNVRVRAGDPAVRFVVRAQRSDHPDESTERLFERARAHVSDAAASRGYREVEATVTHVSDPGDSARTIDTWCEVVFEKSVENLESALEEVRFSLSLEKAVPKRGV